MADRKLMLQACNMSEMNKDALICRLFGFIEVIESQDKSITADDLYNEIKNSVNYLTKENS